MRISFGTEVSDLIGREALQYLINLLTSLSEHPEINEFLAAVRLGVREETVSYRTGNTLRSPSPEKCLTIGFVVKLVFLPNQDLEFLQTLVVANDSWATWQQAVPRGDKPLIFHHCSDGSPSSYPAYQGKRLLRELISTQLSILLINTSHCFDSLRKGLIEASVQAGSAF